LRRRVSRSRDACDRFLPSAASITSTRVSFVLDEVPASRPRKFFRSRDRHPPGGECSSTQRFHAARVTVVDDAFVFPNRSSNHCRACRASSMCQLADPSAAAHTSKLRLERCATRSVKTTPFCDPARLAIERYISSASVLRRLPRATGSGPNVASLSGFRWFCRQRAVHCAVSPLRYRVAFANAIASARPPCTPAYLIDADASLSQSQPFDFCNEFSKYDTRARLPRALSSPVAGVVPAIVATHDALFTLLVSSSFGCKEDSSSMRRSELRVIPRHSPSRGKPRSPERLHPHERHCSSGPAGHGKRAGRKSRAKVNAHDLAMVRDPTELARRGPSS